MRKVMFAAFAAVASTSVFAQFVGFDSPTFSAGSLNAQNSWNTLGTFNVVNTQFQAGDQSVELDTAPITVAWAWATLGSAPNYIDNGVVVTSVWVRYADTTPGDRTDNSAFGLEAWANDGADRYGTVMIGGDGTAYLKSDFASTTVNNLPTVTNPDTWYKVTLVIDVNGKTVEGFLGNTSIGSALLNANALVTNVSDVDLTGYAFGAYAANFGVTTAGGFNIGYFDSYRVGVFPQGTINGKVNLANFSGTVAGRSVTVEVRDSGGAVLDTKTALLNADGEFTVGTSARQTGGGIWVKGSHWLGKVTPRDVTNSGVHNLEVTLINGDVDGNNEVGPGDFSLLANQFGLEFGDAGYTDGADLDGNLEIGPSDFAILSSNFGQEGD